MELKYQQAIKTIIGKDYPQPIVIHEKARASALQAFQKLKKKLKKNQQLIFFSFFDFV